MGCNHRTGEFPDVCGLKGAEGPGSDPRGFRLGRPHWRRDTCTGMDVPEVQLSYGMWSLRSFSRAMKSVRVSYQDEFRDSLPLWHSSKFADARGLSYYCPFLIRRGVVTLGSPRWNPGYLKHIGTTWRSKYRLVVHDRFPSGGTQLDPHSLSLIWGLFPMDGSCVE